MMDRKMDGGCEANWLLFDHEETQILELSDSDVLVRNRSLRLCWVSSCVTHGRVDIDCGPESQFGGSVDLGVQAGFQKLQLGR